MSARSWLRAGVSVETDVFRRAFAERHACVCVCVCVSVCLCWLGGRHAAQSLSATSMTTAVLGVFAWSDTRTSLSTASTDPTDSLST